MAPGPIPANMYDRYLQNPFTINNIYALLRYYWVGVLFVSLWRLFIIPSHPHVITLTESFVIDNDTYYALAVQDWCGEGNYKLHGLWVDSHTQSYPQYCRPVTYIPPTGDLLENMTMSWNNCAGRSNPDNLNTFWKHEWEKHGSCVSDSITEFAFFHTALLLFSNFTQEYMRQVCDTSGMGGMEGSCIIATYPRLP
jgi:hypothetical protein